MPRNLTSPSSIETHVKNAEQIPISLVRLDIPGGEIAINDSDTDVYLNPTTNAVAMAPSAGFVLFKPHAGLTVPEIESNADKISNDVTIGLSNQNEDWFVIMAADAFREAAATIWQGNLNLPVGTAPDAVTFAGAVKVWGGRIESIEADRDTATINLTGHTNSLTMTLPRRSYTAAEFPLLPKPGSKLKWGYTEETV